MSEQQYPQVVYGVVLDDAGSTDYYDTEAEAREYANDETPLVKVVTTLVIERPVPATDEPQEDGPLMRGLAQSRRGETVNLGSFAEYAEQPSLPTREQIAETRDAAWQQRWDERAPLIGPLFADEHAGFLAGFDAAVALLQKGADR